MRIAYITDTYSPEINGVVTSILNFTENLANDGHEILIIAPKYNRKKDTEKEGITVIRYPSFSFASNKETRVAYPLVLKIIRDLREFAPDIIHIQTPLSIGLTGLIAAKILGVKNIQTYHTYIPDFMVYVTPYNLLGIGKAAHAIASSKVFEKIIESDLYKGLDDLSDDIQKDSPIIKSIEAVGKSVRRRNKQPFTERFAWSYTRFLYGRADMVLTPSVALVKLLSRHRVGAPIQDMSNGIDFDRIDDKTSYELTNRMICYGRLGLEKSIDVVVKAFAIAHKKNPKLRLDMIGDGPARVKLENLVKKLNLVDVVQFPGFISNEEMKKNLRNYDFFVTASTIETQGLVILEAMSAGLPVIGVDALAVPELVHNNKNGYLVKKNNPEAMAKAMLKLAESAEKNREFGLKSFEYAKDHDIPNCVNKLESIYSELLAE